MTGAVTGSGGAAYRTTNKDVAQRATSAARQVPTRVGSAAQTTGTFVQENPIISGAVAVALGAALPLMIPSSRRERQLIGEASDEVKSSVRQAVEEKVEQAKDVVQTAAEAATDAARKEVTGKPSDQATAGAVGETPATASSGIDIAAGEPPVASEPTTGVGPTEEMARRQKV
jgi:ElaB/YqjD/DUF883 family membrane-anchored ribosome-binding protein